MGQRYGSVFASRNSQGLDSGASIEPGVVKTEFTSQMRDVRQAVEERPGDMEQLESADVAAAILVAVTQPPRVNGNILTLYPAHQA